MQEHDAAAKDGALSPQADGDARSARGQLLRLVRGRAVGGNGGDAVSWRNARDADRVALGRAYGYGYAVPAGDWAGPNDEKHLSVRIETAAQEVETRPRSCRG